jgi:hypothetical protein
MTYVAFAITPASRVAGLCAAVLALSCGSPLPPQHDLPELPPPGWSLSGTAAEKFLACSDLAVAHGGRASARLQARSAGVDGFASLSQTLSPQLYRGARVRFSGFVRTEGVTGWTGLWMRVDRAGGAPAFDNMQDRALYGTNDWTLREIVLDVAGDATLVQFGLIQDGAGVSHLDDAVLEIAGVEAAVTEPNPVVLDEPIEPSARAADEQEYPDGPKALLDGSFEDDGEIPHEPGVGWFMSGRARDEFEATFDRSERAAGAASARLRPRVESPSGYGTLMQAFLAHTSRGKRLRMTALVKGQGITGRGDLWLRVQAPYSPIDGPGLGGGGCKLSRSFAWRTCEIVFDVPANAISIQLGVGLAGSGTIWLDDVRLEEVARSVPLSHPVSLPTYPRNLDFERFSASD